MIRVTITRLDRERETLLGEPDETVVIFGPCVGVSLENLGDVEATVSLEFRGAVAPPISVITRDA